MKQARRLHRIFDLKREERLTVIGEGLEHLGTHIEQLMWSIENLLKEGQKSAAGALQAICLEESAKVLILLDIARTHDQRIARKGCEYFYSHLPRLIYANVHASNPADFGEIERNLTWLRPSHYLDGPNDVDWIWRNDLLRTRENALYVDYEQTDDGFMWTGGDPDQFYVDTTAARLVLAMKHAGLLTENGARAAAGVWKEAVFDSGTRWEFCRDKAREVLATALPSDTVPSECLRSNVRLILEKWTFPLLSLDLKEVPVSMETLKERQDRYLSRQYGLDDYW
ncbi:MULTISPECIES: AbiV family abortive infection protein [unclassified Pseudarthrobacter]|uniref:AbiV family abortive infection protein n=1 Tax=unclassified Pseudarthrobacter TaxID=2647000 RepID=UPI0030774A2F